mmetsp:Transcript_193/g.289  ORF Transcript_193/g.289 Transcript_193/m.289 type:complete len:222 (-) Transcript_193:1255-1920(-)
MSSSSSAPSEINYHSSVCHWMPCSIAYDGLAPVSMYFLPEAIPIMNADDREEGKEQQQQQPGNEHQHDSHSSNKRDSDATLSRDNKERKVHAATFRGRGLLAQELQELPPQNVRGVVYLPPTSSCINSDTGGNTCTIPSEEDVVTTSSLRIGESFTQVLEWQHECDVKKCLSTAYSNKKHLHGNENNMKRSLDIMTLLQTVHDPIDIVQFQQKHKSSTNNN